LICKKCGEEKEEFHELWTRWCLDCVGKIRLHRKADEDKESFNLRSVDATRRIKTGHLGKYLKWLNKSNVKLDR